MTSRVRIHELFCKGCGLCVAFCGQGLLRMSARRNAHGFCVVECVDDGACTRCRNCTDMCPDSAIEVERCFSIGVSGREALVEGKDGALP